ncbi:MAG: ABC transporter ATP-binding protein [Sarcina sp.]
MENLLEIKKLSINLKIGENREVKAVRDLSLEIRKGETLAIVGESGSGKTIFCKSIVGILPENGYLKEGEIIFQGKELNRLSERSMRAIRGKEIAMVFQNSMTALDPTFTVGSQIVESLKTHKFLERKIMKKRAIELMKTVGIDNAEIRFNHYPHQFSGGMKQRVLIAIALACNPTLLLADEPTTALDSITKREIVNLLKEIQKKNNMTMIFVSHDLSLVSEIADRIAIFYAGKMVEIGKKEEILKNPIHPYTIALMNCLPNKNLENEYLETIEGIPPSLINIPKGDIFAARNKEPLIIDFLKEPPFFTVTETHKVASWLFHPKAFKIRTKIYLKKEQAIKNG